MTCYKVCLMDQVGRLDRLLTKAEVRHCNTTGFLWVIIKVSLCIHICIITDDLDWVLVRTYCSVSSKSPEFTVDRSFRCCDQWLIGFQWQMRYIIIDTNRKFSFCIIVIYSNDLCRCCILGTKSITSCINRNCIELRSFQCCNNIQVQWLAKWSRLFCSVKYRNSLNCIRDRINQSLSTEWSVKTNLDNSDFLACCCQVIDCLLDRITDRSHCYDHMLGICCSIIVK